jgi:hypothetical protein
MPAHTIASDPDSTSRPALFRVTVRRQRSPDDDRGGAPVSVEPRRDLAYVPSA